MGSSAAAGAADSVRGSSGKINPVRRHSVAHVDYSGSSAAHRERYNTLQQAVRSSDVTSGGDGGCVAGASTGADVGKMQAFENVLVTGRKAFARGVDCSALDVLGSQDAGNKHSGSAWPVQQQQQQPWRLSASGAADVAQKAVPSACNTLGPMVGYWD
jgi:hypothetical protein